MTTPKKLNSWNDPDHYRALARSERAAAVADRSRRGATNESIRAHEDAAREYDAKADRLEAEGKTR